MPPDIRAYLEIRTASPANFSPDGETLLVATNLSGTQQLYRTPREGGALDAVTDFEEPVGGAYLPHQRRILLTLDSGGNERHQILAVDEDGGRLERRVHDPEHIHRPGGVARDGRRLAYSSNRRNGVDFDVYLHDLEAPAGADRLAFAPGGWCNAAGFSPDGRWLAVTRPTERSLDNELWLIDLNAPEHSPGRAFEVAPHEGDAAVGPPRWRADGASFYFQTDVGRDRSAIARYDLGARAWRYVLERDWACACWIDWPGRTLLVTTNADGYSEAELLDAETLEVRARVELPQPGVASGWSFSRDGRWLAYQLSSALEPGDVWVCDTDTGRSERLTASPCAVDKRTLRAPALHRLRSFDGESIPLFAYLPPGDGGRLPVVAIIHGGPEGQSRPLFNPLASYLVAHGYAVLVPNVRGSTGYGKRFHHLDDGRRRLDAVRDLEALHDWIRDHERLDEGRAALWGGSYGGYMVLSGLAYQPERWAAGVDIVGVSNLATFLRNTSPWRRAMREREYGSLERDGDFLHEIAPLTHVDRMRAPLFIIHGANDPRVPLSETRQLHAALEKRGVRSELLVYPDEGHGLQKLKNRLDAYPRAVAFLADVLGTSPG